MVTVIIPVLNEEKTIGNVVRYCLRQPVVSEIIVVDDCSEDNTVAEARAAGAQVIISSVRGKGISMKEGIAHASNEILVFLDGDIDPYPADTIASLTAPIIRDDCDFTKARFSRNAGRVTELVAKPLLGILYPELPAFDQPLSGMIAGRKHLLERIDYFSGYGVDIGILLDMFLMNARIQEIGIGHIQNKSKPWRSLAKMSQEVAGAIIHKALHSRISTEIPTAFNAARPVDNW